MLIDRLEDSRREKEEHAAVPEEASARHELLGALPIRLFDEATRSKDTRVELAAHLDVPVARFGSRRSNADRHEVAVSGRLETSSQGFDVGVRLADVVIRGEDRQNRVGIASAHVSGRPPDARGGVAPDRLGEDVRLRELGQLLLDLRTKRLGGHDQRPLRGK